MSEKANKPGSVLATAMSLRITDEEFHVLNQVVPTARGASAFALGILTMEILQRRSVGQQIYVSAAAARFVEEMAFEAERTFGRGLQLTFYRQIVDRCMKECYA